MASPPFPFPIPIFHASPTTTSIQDNPFVPPLIRSYSRTKSSVTFPSSSCSQSTWHLLSRGWFLPPTNSLTPTALYQTRIYPPSTAHQSETNIHSSIHFIACDLSALSARIRPLCLCYAWRPYMSPRVYSSAQASRREKKKENIEMPNRSSVMHEGCEYASSSERTAHYPSGTLQVKGMWKDGACVSHNINPFPLDIAFQLSSITIMSFLLPNVLFPA